jgi:hypothetical protein
MSDGQTDLIASDAELSTNAPDAWLCHICGLPQNMGNHQSCLRITELRHQEEQRELNEFKNLAR